MTRMDSTKHHLLVKTVSQLISQPLDCVTGRKDNVLDHHSQASDILCFGKVSYGQYLFSFKVLYCCQGHPEALFQVDELPLLEPLLQEIGINEVALPVDLVLNASHQGMGVLEALVGIHRDPEVSEDLTPK